METAEITQKELKILLSMMEDHFNDVKSKRISPAKLQETFVAFANSDGGDLYVGIEDAKTAGERVVGFSSPEEANAVIATLLEETEPAVENVSVEFLKAGKKGLVLHIAIPKSPKVHYTAAGDCFIRINAAKKKIKGDRVSQLAYSKGAYPYERVAVDHADIEDVSASKYLVDYMSKVESSLEPIGFLQKQRLLTKKEENRYPNVACVLLFDEEPQATLETRCAIKVYRLRTSDQTYKREQLAEMPATIDGPLESVIHKTIQKVLELISGASFNIGGNLVNLQYPTEALKEVLVNAVIHRDYSLNDDIHVRVFDNRIEVQSPGRLPGYMTIDNLYEERFSRNPNIVRMLHNLPNPVNHDIGEGLDTARNELRKAGLISPSFEEKENAFVVIIKHQKIASIEDVVKEHIRKNPGDVLTNKLIRQLSGEEDMQKVKKALQKLRSDGLIKLVNENATAFNYEYIKA